METKNTSSSNNEERKHQKTVIFIDRKRYELENPTQTGNALKELAGIASTDVLFLRQPGADLVIGNDTVIVLKDGDHLYAQPAADYDRPRHKTIIFINRARYEIEEPRQTGRALKTLGAVALTDVLFLRRPGADVVITNDEVVVLKEGDHLYSQPPADYGGAAVAMIVDDLEGFDLQRQPDGWTFAIHSAFELPDAYLPRVVRLLVKLPPTFPEAAPDMFYVTPVVRTANGATPVGATPTTILGESWQQFSWHLKPGAWQPGISDFREYMRCVRSRFERRN